MAPRLSPSKKQSAAASGSLFVSQSLMQLNARQKRSAGKNHLMGLLP
jgi:hypothetical protein